MKRVLSVFLILTLIFSLGLSLNAATMVGAINWSKALGGTASEAPGQVLPTSDGGFIMVGYSDSQDGDISNPADDSGDDSYDAWIVKLDSSGAKSWDLSLGGTGDDYASDVVELADHSFLVVGETSSYDGDFTDNTTTDDSTDAFAARISSSGSLVWALCYGSTGNDSASSVDLTIDGTIILAGDAGAGDGDVTGFKPDYSGSTGTSTPNYQDYWVLALDTDGNILWNNCYGGSGADSASFIAQTADGGFIVAGQTLSDYSDGDVTDYIQQGDAWLVKLTAAGAITWAHCYGGLGDAGGIDFTGLSGDEASAVVETTDGYLIVAGSSDSADDYLEDNHGGRDAWLFKVRTSDGALAWSKSLGGSESDRANDIALTSDGGFILTGTTLSQDGNVSKVIAPPASSNDTMKSDIWTVRLTSSGSIVWDVCLGGSKDDTGTSIAPLADGGFILGASTMSNDYDVTAVGVGSGQYSYITDAWIVRMNKILTQVKGLSAKSAGFNSVQLSWSAVADAEYYEVERATVVDGTTGGYNKISVDSQQTGTTMTDTGLTTGRTYSYIVRACHSPGSSPVKGADSAAVKAKPIPAAPGSFKAASSGYASVKISWATVSGATGYEIRRATSKSGTYSVLKTITSSSTTSYTNTGLTTGKTYYYKMRTYRTVDGTKVYGSYTAIDSGKPLPAKPGSFKVVRASATSIKTSWAKVSGASGYQVYQATSEGGTFTRVKTITSGSPLSYTKTKLTTGKPYYYKVRAYRIVNDSNVYGSFTAILSATP